MGAGPTRIMPLGDSTTYDDAYNPKPDSLKAAYRSFLWYKLRDAGYWADFVGSQFTGWAVVPTFDGHNEGHPGWTSIDISHYVYRFLQNNPADIILLMIGANDWSEDVDGVNTILNEIDRYESNYHHHIKVILARIPNRREYHQWMTDYNINLQNLANQRISNGDDIYVVDMEHGAGINYPGDFQDPTHPNDTGYSKIANVWYGALRRFLPSPKPSPPSEVIVAKVGLNSALLRWKDNSDNEIGFRIYEGSHLIAGVGANVTSYALSGLVPGTTHTFAIAAYNDDGESPAARVTFTTPSLPSSPTDVKASDIEITKAKLSWKDTSNNETGFDIYENDKLVATVGRNVTSYIAEDLDPGTTYTYSISAYNDYGKSAPAKVTFSTLSSFDIIDYYNSAILPSIVARKKKSQE